MIDNTEKRAKLVLTIEEAQGAAWEDLDPDWGIEVIEDKVVSTGRWANIHRLVIRKDGRFWCALYQKTTREDGDPPPFEEDSPVFTEVFSVPSIEYK